MTALALEGLSVDYGGHPALVDVSFEVAAGEWLGLIGPNGAGKTSLLRAVAALVPHRGTIAVGGASARDLGRRGLAQRIALVEQDPEVPLGMSVAQYVLLGRTPHIAYLAREGRQDRQVAADVLAQLDLVDFADRRLGTLSGGERQRAIVARALAQEPQLLLLDEPTSALDLGRQQRVLDLVAGLRASRGITVVSAMHDLTLAAGYADRLALIAGGRLVALGSPEEVLTPERLTHHYDASLRVVADEEGRIAVIPVPTRPVPPRPRKAA